MRGGKPSFSRRSFSTPQTPRLSLHDQRACRPLDSGRWVGFGDLGWGAHVIGIDVRNGSASIPCIVHVLWVDEGHDFLSA